MWFIVNIVIFIWYIHTQSIYYSIEIKCREKQSNFHLKFSVITSKVSSFVNLWLTKDNLACYIVEQLYK